MLVIRKSQMNLLGQMYFENRLTMHLLEYFPRHFANMGKEQTRRLIKFGMERAQRHGMETERELYIYIGLMLMLGSHFDEDVQIPWVGTILVENRFTTPYAKIEKIQEAALSYLDRVWGVRDEHFKRALARLRGMRLDALLSQSEGVSEERMLHNILNGIHPEKYEVIGESNINVLIRKGADLAKFHQLTTFSGLVIYVGIMFVLGDGFASDPQFPWAAEVLEITSVKPEVRASALYEAALKQLENCLSYKGE